MRFDLSTRFLNGLATNVLMYFQAPELTTIGGGEFLNRILLEIVDPPFFWAALIQAFRVGHLTENGQRSFAWLLLRLISLAGEKADQYIEIAQDSDITNILANSPYLGTRNIYYEIKHVLDMRNAASSPDGQSPPGGRHDNDFADFRDVAILPTADEIMSTKPPFLRPSAALDDPETEVNRTAIYLDNQFRLLREDMIYQLREELQITLGKKKGSRRGFSIDGLHLLALCCGNPGRRCKWGMAFQCNEDLRQLKQVKPDKRKKYFEDNHKVLKHQSIACLIFDDEPVSFPTILRDETLLARSPPVIILQFEGEASTVRTLLKLKTTKNIKLIQIDTAVFSFEPILKALQQAKNMPLSRELLFWKEGSDLEPPPSHPKRIIQLLKADPYADLRKLIGTPKSIILDKSQADSLISALERRVSLIQGPPGMFISR